MIVEAVTGGTIVTPSGLEQADVLIRDGRIAAVGPSAHAAGTGRVVDATGCFVLPGGVDPHSHIMPAIAEAARAAALGGTTTVLSFTNPDHGESAVSCLERRIEAIDEARPAVDIGLHAMIGDPEGLSRSDLAALRRAGSSAIKIFLAYPELGIMCTTKRLYELMTWARELGEIVQVHCENGPLIECLLATGLSAGRSGLPLFVDTRPKEVEEEAVARTITVAALTGATAYLVHLSSAGAIRQVNLARQNGHATVLAEVCLHHLLLDESSYATGDAERFLVAPPLRTPSDIEALWRAIGDGTIDAVGSDHVQERSVGLAEHSASGHGYRYGLAGVGARLPVMLSEGLARGVPIARLAELLSTGPARAFGHYPRKGLVATGSDADLVVFDPAGETIFSAERFDDGTGDSVYNGRTLHGSLRAVVSGGRLVARDGALVNGTAGHGRYLQASTGRP